MKKWMDIDEYFKAYNEQHDKKYPMPKNSTLNSGKRNDEIMEKELKEESKKYSWKNK